MLPDGRDHGVAVRVEDEVALAVEEVRAAVSQVRYLGQQQRRGELRTLVRSAIEPPR